MNCYSLGEIWIVANNKDEAKNLLLDDGWENLSDLEYVGGDRFIQSFVYKITKPLIIYPKLD